jgi:uncharacterized Zn ribbon protein
MKSDLISFGKINLKWIKDLNVKSESLKLLKKGKKLLNSGLGNNVLNMTPKAQAKNNK